MCGGHGSFRLCDDLPHGSALRGDRWPSLQRCLAAVHTRAKGIRAGRQKPDVCRCAAFKKDTSRQPPSALSVSLLVRDVHFGEGGIPEFPTRRMSDRSVLVASVKMSSSSTISYRQMNFQRRLDDRDVVLQFSRNSRVSDTSNGVCHLAESTLLSHDVVSDDITWPTSDLIVRLYLLVSIRHWHRCEKTAQLPVHSQSLEVYTFEPLLLQVPAGLPTDEPQHVPVHRVSNQL